MQIHDRRQSEPDAGVIAFYESFGWHQFGEAFGDGQLWEDPREVSRRYQARCRSRLLPRIGSGGILLDAGCGAVQHPEYRRLHEQFDSVHLVDISPRALAAIPDDARYVKTTADMAALLYPNETFDVTCSFNALNHIAADRQERAVLELLRVLKPGGKAHFILYNKDRFRFRKSRAQPFQRERQSLYWHVPKRGWWRRFESVARMRTWAHRLFFITDLSVIPDNRLGIAILGLASFCEAYASPVIKSRAAYVGITLEKR